MPEAVGAYFWEGQTLRDLLPGSLVDINKGTSYYEVLRVMEGLCLFREDHIGRLRQSLLLAGLDHAMRFEEITAVLDKLIAANRITEGNIRIVLKPRAKGIPVLYAYAIPHSYPTLLQYEKGVPVSLYQASRVNPNIKQYHPQYHRQVREFIQEKQVYEALLVDESNEVTEGSKSNIFFIKKDTVLTAPGSKVLIGITRQKVIALCEYLNIKLIETSISTASLTEMEAAFITGTSPKILPVSNIDQLFLPTENPVMRSLMRAYDGMIREYLYKNKG